MENKNLPAFPVLQQSPMLQNETSLGLTKREYFAAVVISACACDDELEPSEVAERAVKMADALLKALEENTTPSE